MSATSELALYDVACPFMVMFTVDDPSPTFSQKVWSLFRLTPCPRWRFLLLVSLNTYVPDLIHSQPSS